MLPASGIVNGGLRRTSVHEARRRVINPEGPGLRQADWNGIGTCGIGAELRIVRSGRAKPGQDLAVLMPGRARLELGCAGTSLIGRADGMLAERRSWRMRRLLSGFDWPGRDGVGSPAGPSLIGGAKWQFLAARSWLGWTGSDRARWAGVTERWVRIRTGAPDRIRWQRSDRSRSHRPDLAGRLGIGAIKMAGHGLGSSRPDGAKPASSPHKRFEPDGEGEQGRWP